MLALVTISHDNEVSLTAGAVPDLFSLTFSGELAAGHSVLAAAYSSAMGGMPLQGLPTESAAPPAAEPGSSTQDAAPASNGPAEFAAGLQADNGVLPHAAPAQASRAAFDSSHKVKLPVHRQIFSLLPSAGLPKRLV